MTEWIFDLSKVSVKDVFLLQYLGMHGYDSLMMNHLSEVFVKAGIQLDDITIQELPELMEQFGKEIAKAMEGKASWPGIWATYDED